MTAYLLAALLSGYSIAKAPSIGAGLLFAVVGAITLFLIERHLVSQQEAEEQRQFQKGYRVGYLRSWRERV